MFFRDRIKGISRQKWLETSQCKDLSIDFERLLCHEQACGKFSANPLQFAVGTGAIGLNH